jgi:alpha-1,2-mannosyltransferase
VTLKRIRVYATLIAATLWTVWVVDFSGPGVVDRLGKVKGTDFLQFYVGGSFVREGRLNQLYELQALYARAQAIVPDSRETLYVPMQSPQTLFAFSPVSVFPYPVAVTIWIAVIMLLYAASCVMTWRYCTALHRYRAETLACAVAFPGLFSTVLHGQTSAVALLFVATALFALRHGRPFIAGLAIGCLAFKPHWLLAAGAVFMAVREWRVVAGALTAAAGQTGITFLLVGPAVMSAYWRTLQTVQRLGDVLEPYPGDSLRSFFKVFLPWEPVALLAYLLGAVATQYLAMRIWRSRAPFEVRSSSVVLATLLVSPHAFPYDLILLAPVYFLLANWFADHPSRPPSRAISYTLCVLFVAPLLRMLPAPLRLQFSVTAMALLLVWLWQAARSGETTASIRSETPHDGRQRLADLSPT